MYGVLNTVVQTSKGKEILRMHYKDPDAQKVYAELCLHYETSTAAVIDSTDTYQYLITAKVNDWSGGTEKFIMHWFEQVRLYETTAETEAHLTDGQKMMLLINAVKDNHELATVDTNFKTLLALDPTKKPSLEQYKALPLSAAVRYDRSTGKGTSRKNPVRQVYAHDLHESSSDVVCDIDTPHYEVMQAVTNPSKQTKVPRRKATLRWDQWKDMPDAARQLWDKLDDDDKRTILRYHDPNHPKTQRVEGNYHDIWGEVDDDDGFIQVVVYGINKHSQSNRPPPSVDPGSTIAGKTTITSNSTPAASVNTNLPPGHPQRMFLPSYSVNMNQSKTDDQDDFR